jgi:N utilization substance protein B
LRALFQIDVAGAAPEEALTVSASDNPYSEATVEYARELILGCREHVARIDGVMERYARGWTLARMANVDRNVLRLATFELLFRPDVHPSVVVDEAVELAKKYSTAESGRFVNGVLGSLVRSLEEERQEPAEG